MTPPTIAQVRARLVSIAALIPNIKTALSDYPMDNQPFEVAEMPVIVVRVGQAANSRLDANGFAMLRTYQLILHAARALDDISNPSTTEMQAVEPFLSSVPLHFLARPRLELNDAGLVVSTTLPQDAGLQRIVRESAVYWGAVFTMQIQTIYRG